MMAPGGPELASLDLDLFGLGFRLLGQDDGQDPVSTAGLDLVLVHPGRQRDLAIESADNPFREVTLARPFGLFGLFLAPDRQFALRQREINIWDPTAIRWPERFPGPDRGCSHRSDG